VIVQSELVANEAKPVQSDDPRVAAALDRPLVAVEQDARDLRAVMLHETRSSRLLMAAGMDHDIEVEGRVEHSTEARDDWARTTVVCGLRAGQKLRIVKYLAYGWSGRRSQAAVRDQVAAALTGARYSGWDGLVKHQREYLAEFWDGADVEVGGDPVVQQAVRLALFHVLQAGARAERRAIPAKGLTGPGYDGHSFWDTEGFVLPLLTWTVPDSAADVLRWRHSILDMAQERARLLGLQGASFPWRTIRGQECSAYWPAGTAAFHINADIAFAVDRYRIITGDTTLEQACGLELLVETARLWVSLGHHDAQGAWHVDGVTGPDEYTAVIDDNVFTNLMAARNLTAAADACQRNPDASRRLGVTHEESAQWRDAARTVHIPYDEQLGVHEQSDRFTRFAEWDFSAHEYPLLMHAPYVQLYRKQVIKQADVVLAMHWCGEHFTPEQKARNVDYYERRTVRDSSLSACTQALLCADVGHLELAHDYLHEALLVDLRDLHRNTGDGMHLASLAGGWSALVEGFGGLRVVGEGLTVDPQLPEGLTRLDYRVRWRGQRLLVEVRSDVVRVTARDVKAGEVALRLVGEELTVGPGATVERPWQRRTPLLPRPEQPPGRAPMQREDMPTVT
jgi:trehalose/maltose hydrolase-like predicted phosphorylase